MADSLDPATSILLCCEDTSTCFDDDLECNDVVGSGILPFWPHTNVNSFNQGPSFVLQSEEIVRVMIEREREHLPRDDYINRLRSGELDMSIRREAIDWICKGHAYYGYGYLTFCLAVNYLDRFLSVYELPRGKSWTGQLLAVACLSIAGKMDEIKVPQSVDLQVGEPDFFFDGKTIQRMELLVLGTLRWKMNALTPCSFIDYFLSRITYEKQPSKLFISTSIQLVVSLIRGIDFLEFKPSEIAAAVAVYVTREVQAKDIDKVHVGFSIVKEERVLKCVELIRDLSFNVSANLGSNNNYAPCVPGSPVRVLDTRCLSFKSDDELTVGSCPNTSLNIPNTKIPKSDQPS